MSISYEETHPWLTFKLEVETIPDDIWLTLGEAISKADHVTGAPLLPDAASQLNLIYLTKGIHATTSIEGNTLSEEEVSQRVQGELELPASLEYQGEEIDNLVEALNLIREECTTGQAGRLDQDRIKRFNENILKGQPTSDGVVPGEYRTHSVLVGNVYRGAPAEECEYLMGKLITFINDDLRTENETYKRPVLLLRAILAHLYLAWIHPFGDGNGRTARLIETQLLFEAGVPVPAAHLLSDFYNKTRPVYYKKLEEASRNRDLNAGLIGFIRYAVEGFRDGLKDQVEYIQSQQLKSIWLNFVHGVFNNESHTPAQKRRKLLVLAMSPNEVVQRKDMTRLDPDLAIEYSGTTARTLSRDINDLMDKQLIRKKDKGYVLNLGIVAAFLPQIMDGLD
ncbi:Fic family protein [Corynebacterium suicordis]